MTFTTVHRRAAHLLGAALILCTASLASLAYAKAPGDASATRATTTPLKDKDMRFINDAASAGMFEVEASKLALQRSSNAKIKDFAQHMVADHDKNAAMLKDVAQSKGVTVPIALMAPEQKKLDELKGEKTGKDFDQAYCEAMVSSHKDAVGKFRGAKEDLADSDLRIYASTSLPTLEHHTEMAQELNGGKS